MFLILSCQKKNVPNINISLNIYIYIYIYIFEFPQKKCDCFVFEKNIEFYIFLRRKVISKYFGLEISIKSTITRQ
jgi:hypothetical protein